MDDIRPLSVPQQRFLQRLFALHVASTDILKKMWQEVKDSSGDEVLGPNLEETLATINRSLKPAFGLEIRSVVVDVEVEDDENDEGGTKTVRTPFVSIINLHGDDVSKASANPSITKNPHELALFRLIIEKLVESANEDEESDDDGESSNRRRKRNRGCNASMSRMDMINMRTELKGAHAGKLTISQVEQLLNQLVVEGWFVAAEGSESEQAKKKSSRKKRASFGGSALQLGPRSYLEFADFLQKAGLDKEMLPQFIVY